MDLFRGPIWVNLLNFVSIAWTFAEIWPFYNCGHAQSSVFRSSKFYLPIRWGRPICECLPNFMRIGRSLQRYGRYSTAANWDLLYVYLDHPRRAFVGLCHCAKFCWNRCSSFDNMSVLMFCEFGLKMPTHAPFWVVFVGFDPLNETQYHSVSQNFHLRS